MKTDLYLYSTEPFAHQIEAEKFISKVPDYFALFMEQGTGKTKTTIDFIENMYLAKRIDRVLVIAPNGVHKQWAESEVVVHGFVPSETFVWHSDKKHRNMFDAWLAKNTDALRYFCVNVEAFSVASYLDLFLGFVKGGKTAIVIDEATAIKNPQAQRTVNIVQGLARTFRSGKRVCDIVPYAVCRCILTGTPEANGVHGLWSMFEFLKHDYFGMSYYAFRAHYCMEYTFDVPNTHQKVRKLMTAADIVRVRDALKKNDIVTVAMQMGVSERDVQYIYDHPALVQPYKNLDELRERIAKRAFIVKKSDCLDLPEKIHEVRYVPMSTEQAKLYKSMKANAYAMYKEQALDAKQRTTIQMRLHQIAGGFFPATYDLSEGFEQAYLETQSTPIGTPPKFTAIKSMLEDGATFPVIITTAFRAEAEYLAQELSKDYTCALIIGGMSNADRNKAEADFKSGNAQILIATERTIAKGFNFQFCSTMYLYSSTSSSEDRMQLEDRIHRIGQKNHPLYVDFITESSVDVAIKGKLDGDADFQRMMLSSDADEFFKAL